MTNIDPDTTVYVSSNRGRGGKPHIYHLNEDCIQIKNLQREDTPRDLPDTFRCCKVCDKTADLHKNNPGNWGLHQLLADPDVNSIDDAKQQLRE